MKLSDDTVVRIAKALSDPTRLRIFRAIGRLGRITCGEAEKLAQLTQPTISHHVKVLCETGLLKSEKNGRHVFISVNQKILRLFVKQFSGH